MADHTKLPDISFQEIHDEFRPRILRYLRSIVGEADAEDLAQDVFVKVARGPASGGRSPVWQPTWSAKRNRSGGAAMGNC